MLPSSVTPQALVIEIQALSVYFTRFTLAISQLETTILASVELVTLPHLVITIPPLPHSEIFALLITESVVEVNETALEEMQ